MKTSLILVCSLLMVLQGFVIRQDSTKSLQSIPWPFQVSDPIEWDVEAVYLSQRPARKVTFNTMITGTTPQDIFFTAVDFTVFYSSVVIHEEKLPFNKNYFAGERITFEYLNYFIPLYAPPGDYEFFFSFRRGDFYSNSIGFYYIL